MKVNLFFQIFVILIVLMVYGCAPQVDPEAEEATLQEMMENIVEALEIQDWQVLQDYFSDDWQHFTGMGTVWNFQEFRNFFETHITEDNIDISNLEIEVGAGATLAWAKFNEETQFMFDSNPMEQTALLTAIFRKDDLEWKMAHLHRSVEMPLPSPEETSE